MRVVHVTPFILAAIVACLPADSHAGTAGEADAQANSDIERKAEQARKLAEADKENKRIEAERLHKEKAEAQKLARQEKEKEAEREREERARRCVIKPVMTDDEINLCKASNR